MLLQLLPLQECIAILTEEELELAVSSCILDVCVMVDVNSTFLCEYAEAIVETCAEHGFIVTDWRTDDFCRKLLNRGRIINYLQFPDKKITSCTLL